MEVNQDVKKCFLLITALILCFYVSHIPVYEKSIQTHFSFNDKDGLRNNSLKGEYYFMKKITSPGRTDSKIVINFEIDHPENCIEEIIEILDKELKLFEMLHDRLRGNFQ
nr:MAG: hypothetical protein [Porcellio scaber clopovirus]